ncbi:MAG: energy transducer TonB [Bacteroidota bacterium]
MKKILITFLCVGAFIVSKAQTSPAAPPVFEIDEPKAKVDTSERAPSFAGGEKQLTKYLRRNQRTLSETHGRVVVTFIVEKDGSLSEAKVIRSVSEAADEEALRIIKKMPKWNPGIQNNNPVRVQYSMPITFD